MNLHYVGGLRGDEYPYLWAGSTPLVESPSLVCFLHAVLDNLVKGAAGQAMQNLNIMMGQPEETALMQQAMFP